MSTEKPEPDQVNLHPGQYDEGGEGGMATRELAARQQQEDDEQED
jgi:hypothetical protein